MGQAFIGLMNNLFHTRSVNYMHFQPSSLIQQNNQTWTMTPHKCLLASHLDSEKDSEAVAGFPCLLQAYPQLRSLLADSQVSFVYTTTVTCQARDDRTGTRGSVHLSPIQRFQDKSLMSCGGASICRQSSGSRSSQAACVSKGQVSRSVCQPDCNGISSVAMWVQFIS